MAASSEGDHIFSPGTTRDTIASTRFPTSCFQPDIDARRCLENDLPHTRQNLIAPGLIACM
ncbi:MAG TPA: hypothetical protein PKB10_07485 [Tepidisphaeraceae bacterium]|nr:hypothetical protein [Tepidisphaeraceae bacterium]